MLDSQRQLLPRGQENKVPLIAKIFGTHQRQSSQIKSPQIITQKVSLPSIKEKPTQERPQIASRSMERIRQFGQSVSQMFKLKPKTPVANVLTKSLRQGCRITPMTRVEPSTDLRHASEYLGAIQQNMQRDEHLTLPDPVYMKQQPNVTENARAQLINKLIYMQKKFKLQEETLFLTSNMFDRYLSAVQVKQTEELTLICIACLLIACKYEEIYPPNGRELITAMDSDFTYMQLLQTESFVLAALQFTISETTPYTFLTRYKLIARQSDRGNQLALYLLQLALFDSKMNQYPPSLQASAALYVAMRVQISYGLKQEDGSCWGKELKEQTTYSSSDLKPCAKNYFQLADLITKSQMQHVVTKFSLPEHHQVCQWLKEALSKPK